MGKFDNFISLDLGKMSADDNHFGSRGGKRPDRMKVAPGETKVIRLLRAADDSLFYRVRSQHWNIPVGHGKSGPPYACSAKHGTGRDSRCYFCEQINDYYNSGDPRLKELAQKSKQSVSVMSNVLDVNNPLKADGSPNVMVWSYSWKMFQKVRAYFRDADYGDLTHPVTGRNFKLSASIATGNGGSSWTHHDLQIGASPKELEVPEALDHLYDLDTCYPVKVYSYEEQKMIWDGTWDPRSGVPAIEAHTAAQSRIEEPVKAEAPPVETPAKIEAPPVEEFEAAADADDDWDDVLDDVDDEKQQAIRNKLDQLKKAAKKK
jgi:hypothetical protein